MIDANKTVRWCNMASTWFSKAVWILVKNDGQATSDEQRWGNGYYAARTLEDVLRDSELLVGLVPDEMVADVEELARDLLKKLRDRRLAAQLEDVEGRSPEEAALFLAKAAELRSS